MVENTNVNINALKYLKYKTLDNTYMVSLVDSKDFEITVGYGDSLLEAINDLHGNLV